MCSAQGDETVPLSGQFLPWRDCGPDRTCHMFKLLPAGLFGHVAFCLGTARQRQREREPLGAGAFFNRRKLPSLVRVRRRWCMLRQPGNQALNIDSMGLLRLQEVLAILLPDPIAEELPHQ